MTTTTKQAADTSSVSRSRRRLRSAGVTAIEEILMIAAVAGCFVVPLSRAAISSGRQISKNTEAAHDTILRQR